MFSASFVVIPTDKQLIKHPLRDAHLHFGIVFACLELPDFQCTCKCPNHNCTLLKHPTTWTYPRKHTTPIVLTTNAVFPIFQLCWPTNWSKDTMPNVMTTNAIFPTFQLRWLTQAKIQCQTSGPQIQHFQFFTCVNQLKQRHNANSLDYKCNLSNSSPSLIYPSKEMAPTDTLTTALLCACHSQVWASAHVSLTGKPLLLFTCRARRFGVLGEWQDLDLALKRVGCSAVKEGLLT